MSAVHDRQFLDMFSLIVGILVGVAAGIYFLAVHVAGAHQSDQLLHEGEYQRQVAARIAPPEKVAIAGRDNSAFAIVPDTRAAQAKNPMTVPTNGTEVFQQVCVACHGQGIAGAPRAGDAGAWSARIAKGKNTLYQHAIEGFKGEAGQMPAKGGRTDLSDDLIRSAVDQMIEASR